MQKDGLEKPKKLLIEPSSFSILYSEIPMNIGKAKIGRLIKSGEIAVFHVFYSKGILANHQVKVAAFAKTWGIGLPAGDVHLVEKAATGKRRGSIHLLP